MSAPALIIVATPGTAGAPAAAMPPPAVARLPLPPAFPPEVSPTPVSGLRPPLAIGASSPPGAPPTGEKPLSLAHGMSRVVRPPQADNAKNPHKHHDTRLG